MYYVLDGHEHDYETQTIIQVFCPNERYQRVEKPPKDGFCVFSKIEGDLCFCVIYNNGTEVAESFLEARQGVDKEKEEQRLIKTTVFNAFAAYDPQYRNQPWGVLTGIRPAKIVSGFWRDGLDDDEVRRVLREDFLVSPQKLELSINVAKAEQEVLAKHGTEGVSVYAGVPFCPTRCLYCSFTSYPIGRYEKKLETYFAAMEREIDLIGEYSQNHAVKSIYIGGGTPTSLPEEYFERLLGKIREKIDCRHMLEFTVEAGRPDTITAQKLQIMKRHGVTRISVNPQTMNDKTLEVIGRKHTSADFLNAYKMAKDSGFDNINIDLIIGLPNETIADVKSTFEKIAALEPVSVTVHTLSVKRASELNQSLPEYTLTQKRETEEMLAVAAKYCEEMGVFPYYMYKQKNMLGNFENVGYAKKGYECSYNVITMEECQQVIALGAGAVTKLINGRDGRIERIFNVKGIEEYISRIDEMLERKKCLR